MCTQKEGPSDAEREKKERKNLEESPEAHQGNDGQDDQRYFPRSGKCDDDAHGQRRKILQLGGERSAWE